MTALALILALLLAGCAMAAGTGGAQRVEMFAVNVGKGDAILICVDDYACLIDAGKAYARGKILTAMKRLGLEALDAVFLTHTDGDHADGLEWLAESDIPVGTWYASGMYTGVKEKKHPAVKAAEARGAAVVWLERGDRVELGDTGAAFEVLAPSVLNEDKDDNNSLVMMLETSQGRMLLTGDMELVQEAALLAEGDDLSCAVLKVPNHADDDTTSDLLARAAGAQIAVISTDSQEKPETPDPGVVARLQAAGSACWVTQDASLGISVTLSGGEAVAELVDIDAPNVEGISISEVVPGDDIVVLYNGGEAQDLSGWYLYSDRGEEMFVFPGGYSLAAGEVVVIGSNSSEGEPFDLLWDDKKVIHASKEDIIMLYDGCGRAVDAMSNGL